MNIKEISKEIYDNNVAKGFWDEERNVGEMLMLVVSELSEALEAHRKDRFSKYNISAEDENSISTEEFEENIKDSFEDEICDAVIRLFDISKGLKIDLGWHIRAKLNYNKTRPHKHGKKY